MRRTLRRSGSCIRSGAGPRDAQRVPLDLPGAEVHNRPMRLRAVLLPVFVVAMSGCQGCTELALLTEGGGGGPSHQTTTPVVDKRIVPTSRYLYGEGNDEACTSSTGGVMPCRLVLHRCNRATNSSVEMPAVFACTPEMPSTDEACAEQPEYAAYYGCRSADDDALTP